MATQSLKLDGYGLKSSDVAAIQAIIEAYNLLNPPAGGGSGLAAVDITGATVLTVADHGNRHASYTNGGVSGTLTLPLTASAGDFFEISNDDSQPVILNGADILAGGPLIAFSRQTFGAVYSSGKWNLLPPALITKYTQLNACLYPIPQDTSGVVGPGIKIATVLDSCTSTARSMDNSTIYGQIAREGRTAAAAAISRLAGFRTNILYMAPGTVVDADVILSLTAAPADANSGGQFGMGVSGGAPAWTNAIEPSAMTDCIFMGADSTDTNMSIMHNDNVSTCTKELLNASFPRDDNGTKMYKFTHRFRSVGGVRSVDWVARELISGAVLAGTFNTDLPRPTFQNMTGFIVRGSANVSGAAASMSWAAMEAGRFASF